MWKFPAHVLAFLMTTLLSCPPMATSDIAQLDDFSRILYDFAQQQSGNVFINPCENAPCLNSGSCMVTSFEAMTFICRCMPGYTGPRCERGLDECESLPCNQGACVDHIGSFSCYCHPGFTGRFCDAVIDQCATAPCQHGSTCNQTRPGYFTCLCPPGFRGLRCETDIDECLALSPCQNGGTCLQADPGSYSCRCRPGFSGRDCQTTSSKCRPNPCQNEADCVELRGVQGFRCLCSRGFTGTLCDTVQQTVNACPPGTSCGDGACVQLAEGGFRCQCNAGYTGTDCLSVADACLSGPCQNGGVCRLDTQGSYVCECPNGFSGASCNERQVPCRQACLNGGTCVTAFNGTSFCQCANGYTGSACEVTPDPCSRNPCLNNATCRPQPGRRKLFTCQCGQNYWGSRCQYQIVSTTTPASSGSSRNSISPTTLIAILSVFAALCLVGGVTVVASAFVKRPRKSKDVRYSLPPVANLKPPSPPKNNFADDYWHETIDSSMNFDPEVSFTSGSSGTFYHTTIGLK